MLVRDLMQENPQVLSVGDSIGKALKQFAVYKLKAVPVIDNNKTLQGMVTAADLLIAVADAGNVLHNTVNKIMSKNVVAVHSEDRLTDVYQIKYKFIPVVDEQSILQGLLSRQDIMKVIHRRMRKAENALEQMIAISYGGMIIMDEHTIIYRINDIAAQLLGTTQKLALGHLARDIHIDKGIWEIIHSGKAEKNFRLKIDGKELIASRTPIWEGCRVKGVLMTILSTSKREEELLQQNQKQNIELKYFNNIFESICQGIIAVGTDKKIYYANHAYEDIMGISRESLVGQSVDDAVENSRVSVVLRTGIPEFGALQTVNNRRVIVNRLPIFEKGKIVGAIGQAVFKNIEEVERLLQRNRQALAQKQLNKVCNKEGMATFEDIAGTSLALLQAKNLAAKVAATDTTVLIQGESGTGKDLFAQAIHSASDRVKGEFIAVNCAAIPSELLESELFGYAEGAFTGAKKGGKKGKFELAEGGTLFLDEIGDMPFPMQAKLLRVIQNKAFERVGGEKLHKCDVRIIAATNHDLQRMVIENKFREDLYYRLHVVCINVPPLRQRSEDIGELIETLLPKICEKSKLPCKKFSPEAIAILEKCPWPGNIRELINFIEQISATVDSVMIMPKHLPDDLLAECNDDRKTDRIINPTVINEDIRIREAIKTACGNKSMAAKLLGIHRSTLYLKIKKYHLDKML